jgi:hypothetical protein
MPDLLAGRDVVRLETADLAVRSLAEGLWTGLSGEGTVSRTLFLSIRTLEEEVPGDPEGNLRWELGADETRLSAPGLSLRVLPRRRRASATVSRSLVRHRADLVSRLLLEAPVTAMKMAGRQQLLHAGAVVGRAGAVVLRGPSGSGKSTLVAACRHAGLGFLGDESLLVEREAPDELEATLRDLVLTPDSARLLGLEACSTPFLSDKEIKRRVHRPEAARPADRLARRIAVVLLGPRDPGPARLVPIEGREFAAAFAEGEIPQERMHGGSPERIAREWAGRGSHLLLGAVDLAGAVERLRDLAHGPGQA